MQWNSLPNGGFSAADPKDVLADQEYPDLGDFGKVRVEGHGYRWIRMRRTA